MRYAFASFLLFAAAMALLGGVALACAMLSRAAAPIIPTPADMPQGRVLVCLTPIPACPSGQCPRPVVKT